MKNNRQILSKFTIHGTLSIKRGILVFVKKKMWLQGDKHLKLVGKKHHGI